ncbi:MAG: DNA-3-methyladenine glycosylase 2 family protein [Ruminococcus sp.]|nr:DNA-3-methyladenine glycosylase 2 family protein [Ruminococcus sp.]
MDCIKTDTGVKISGVKDLDLAQTLDCGQSFRWVENDSGFYGIAFEREVVMRLEGTDLYIDNCDEKEFEIIWKDYLDLNLDYGKIRKELSELHPILKEAGEYASGIRILRQEPWEALCTFIISQNNNIKRIKGIVARLCESFGDRVGSGYSFPTAERLSELTPDDLAPLRAGFRNKYIIDAARKVAGGEVNLEKCRALPYDEARSELMKIKGVGVKVADCALLFGLHRIEAFPVDVWMKRALEKLFPDMTPSDFGEYAGIAQQYIFHYSRMHPELFN